MIKLMQDNVTLAILTAFWHADRCIDNLVLFRLNFQPIIGHVHP